MDGTALRPHSDEGRRPADDAREAALAKVAPPLANKAAPPVENKAVA